MSGNQNRFSNVRVLIFDLDGTLIDSALDLAHSVNATLEHMGRAPLTHETVYSYVGNGALTLVRRALGESATDAECEKGHAYFLAYYREHMLDNTVTYPGVREALEQLKEQKMAVLTNKPVRFSEEILMASDCRSISNASTAATVSRRRNQIRWAWKSFCANWTRPLAMP